MGEGILGLYKSTLGVQEPGESGTGPGQHLIGIRCLLSAPGYNFPSYADFKLYINLLLDYVSQQGPIEARFLPIRAHAVYCRYSAPASPS